LTQPHPASLQAPSSPADPGGPDTLIAPADRIFDLPAERRAMAAALDAASGELDARKRVVAILSQARDGGRAAIAEAFGQAPLAARRVTRSYRHLTDGIVLVAFETALALHPRPNPTKGERLALMAVGGYGRGDMAPESDVDLLFLTPYKITPWAESVIETMLYILWDLKLKVGHASRTIKDCLRLATEDYTIRTALLETRYLTGDEALAAQLERTLWRDLFENTARDFINAKLAERDARHVKQGQRYMVEPNVKEGKGGLRDLQSLFWIAKYVHRTDDTRELVDRGVFRLDEYDSFVAAERFLWAVRCHMHLIAGRAVEQLTFDMQVEVAARMGYVDRGARRAVERFMQDYFRAATAVGDMTRIFLTALEAENAKEPAVLHRILKRKPRVKQGYVVMHNRLAIADTAAFLSDKLNLLRLFEEALRTGLLLHPEAMRLVKANLGLIDGAMRANPEARRIFLDLLLKHGNPERALRRMNELGVLGAFIPEFAPIVAMMQFNMYHHYTVDEHTIQCIKTLSEIEQGQLAAELPVATDVLKSGVNRRGLYLALLMHDTGKGRSEDHSVLGARIVRRVATRMGLKPAEVATAEWLVRYHLLMSDMAQKRDIADPRTVRAFAKAVQTRERLDLLFVLTVCDIRGVGPGTWNNWKAALLRALYRQTRRALDGGLEALNRENRGTEAKRLLRQNLKDWDAKDIRAETTRHYPPYWQGLHVTAHVVFARLLRDISEDAVAIDIHPDEGRDATRACFVLQDHPGIFSRLTGALALAGANVVDARTFTTKDGYATAAFWLQDADGTPYDSARIPRLRETIRKTLAGEVVARAAIEPKEKLKRREKAFNVPTSITFDNEASDIFTVIEVDTRDRRGLLHDLARTLAGQNIYINSAIIATYGEQVVDTFYVKDMFGLKLQSTDKRAAIERKLREAIAVGAERART
jgi:[protein-PII] uridylyltransferase